MKDLHDLRILEPREKLFFMYSVGIRKAHHNIRWAINNWITEVDVYIAEPVNYLNATPFVIVSKGDLHRIRDPHIKEHQWRKVSVDEVKELYNQFVRTAE